eukprot:tig00000737_g3803.t1
MRVPSEASPAHAQVGDGNYHHVVLTATEGEVATFLNGTRLAHSKESGGLAGAAGRVPKLARSFHDVGNNADGGLFLVNTHVADFKVWNASLAAAEALADFQGHPVAPGSLQLSLALRACRRTSSVIASD